MWELFSHLQDVPHAFSGEGKQTLANIWASPLLLEHDLEDEALCEDYALMEMADITAAARLAGRESVAIVDNLHGQTTTDHPNTSRKLGSQPVQAAFAVKQHNRRAPRSSSLMKGLATRLHALKTDGTHRALHSVGMAVNLCGAPDLLVIAEEVRNLLRIGESGKIRL